MVETHRDARLVVGTRRPRPPPPEPVDGVALPGLGERDLVLGAVPRVPAVGETVGPGHQRRAVRAVAGRLDRVGLQHLDAVDVVGAHAAADLDHGRAVGPVRDLELLTRRHEHARPPGSEPVALIQPHPGGRVRLSRIARSAMIAAMPGADLDLFPRPRAIEAIGPGVPASSPVHVTVDLSIPEQGYEIVVAGDRVQLTHADDAGLRYAESTLEQLRARAGDELPGVRIADAPDFPTRGYMLDVSRDRVPTRATLERLVGLCALARINHFELYTEHTYSYRDHEVVWRDASPMTDRRRDLARRALRVARDRPRRQPELLRSHGSVARAPAVPRVGGVPRRLRARRRVPHGADGARAHAGECGVRADPVRGAAAQLPVAARQHRVRRDLRPRPRGQPRRGGAPRQGAGLRRPPAPHRRAARGRRLRGPLLGRHRAQGSGPRRRAPRDRNAGVLDLRGARPRCAPARGARGPAGRARRRSPRRLGLRREHRSARAGRRAVLGRAGHVGVGLARRAHRQRGRQPRRRGRGRPRAGRAAT